MTRVVEIVRRYPLAGIFVAFVLVVAVGYWRTQQIADQAQHSNRDRIAAEQSLNRQQQALIAALKAEVACTEELANALVGRSKQLAPLADKREAALFAALHAGLAGHPKIARRYAELADRYNSAYRREQRKHPVPTPASPCKVTIPTSAPAHRPAPHPSVIIRTTTAPAPPPIIRHVPGPVRIVRVPGPTVTVPPGHRHH